MKYDNKKAWNEIYNKTNFGNKYPSSYFVSLYFRIIRELIPKEEKEIKVLDFGCSFGAESKMLKDQGLNVYGVDISKNAIQHCIDKMGFSKDMYISCDILNDKENLTMQNWGKFDLIIASEVMYYFGKTDCEKILGIFGKMLNENGVFYANMPTFNHEYYREYIDTVPSDEGTIPILSSGVAAAPMCVRIVHNKDEVRSIFSCFDEIAVLRTVFEINSENESIHFLGKKKPNSQIKKK